jgi:hypothetical protein
MSPKRKQPTARLPRPRAEPDPPRPDPAAFRAALAGVVARANAGDRAALAELRAVLDRHPDAQQAAGDLARLAEAAWLDLVAAGNALAREALQRELARLKADLAGPHPTGLERLLVADVCVSYLAKRQAEIAAASPAGGSLPQAAFRLRRVESAQRRFLTAVKVLTKLRALVPEGLAPRSALHIYSEAREHA